MKRKRHQQDIESAHLQALYSSALLMPPQAHVLVPPLGMGVPLSPLTYPAQTQFTPESSLTSAVGSPHVTLGLAEKPAANSAIGLKPFSQSNPIPTSNSLFLPALGLSATVGLSRPAVGGQMGQTAPVSDHLPFSPLGQQRGQAGVSLGLFSQQKLSSVPTLQAQLNSML